MSRLLVILLVTSILISCAPQNILDSSSTTPDALVPSFEHIIIVIFENEDFVTTIGNSDMPFFNQLAEENTLLTGYYAVRHPSLPNYIALIGGDTFGIDQDCNDCFVDAPSLPDLIEASGRSWKTYQEDMPQPCYLGDAYPYAQKHNPFVYFDSVRLDQERCERSVVPLTELNADIRAGTLPDFVFITPNLCNDAHDCELSVADQWLENLFATIMPALEENDQPYLVVLTFDEGIRKRFSFGLQKKTGGQVPVILISPAMKKAFRDDTHYNHYSLLKTIAESWGLPYLGHAADENDVLITAPWE
jgi:phosphatidylinositol-3-phosphatase